MDRIARLRHEMRSKGIDTLLCLKPQNSFYVTGFNPVLYSHPVVAVLTMTGDPVLLVYALRDDHARLAGVTNVRLFGSWSTKKTMGPDWLSALQTIFEESETARGTIGIEGDFLPLNVARELERRLPGARFEDASGLIMTARMIKDDREIALCRSAAAIADAGMEVALAAVAERQSEREISVRAMAAMNRAWLERFPDVEVADFGSLEGGIHNGLWCYCLAGDRVALNCDNPILRRPAPGELVMIVIWTVCDGLHAENERTVAIGALDDQRRRAFEAILQIREEAQQAICPGVTCSDLYGTAKRIYERLGYGTYVPGRIGHGMGLGGHELPSIQASDPTEIRPGMVLTFEPNLRIPEFGGLQHSDTLLVTETGFEFLTRTRRDFIRV